MSRSSLDAQNEPRPDAPLSALAAQVEAVLFLASSPVSERELRDVLGASGAAVSSALDELGRHLDEGHGLTLRALAGGWTLATDPALADVLARFRDTAQRGRTRLTRAAVETLAIVAYEQPVTRSEVEEIRGARSERVLARLLSYGLVRLAGRKKAVGSPLLYRTTPRFLEAFGLDAIADLPSLDELVELGVGPVEDAPIEDDEPDVPGEEGEEA